MLVTAIISTYKREPRTVERALSSIVNQTHKELEIIVVDDSPNDYPLRDDVKNVVLGFKDNRITYIQHERNMGACQARNTGLRLASGEYVGFLDDDDTWEPQKIEVQLNRFLNGDSQVGLVYCGYYIYDETTGIKREKHPKRISGEVFDQLILDNFIGGTSCPLMRTSFLKKIGGFDVQMQSAQDADVWLRMSKECLVDYVDDSLYTYYIVHTGEQISTNPKKKLLGLLRLYNKNEEYLIKHPYSKWVFLGKLAPNYTWNGLFVNGLKTWIKMIVLQPFRVCSNLKCLLKMMKRALMYLKKQQNSK